VAGIMTDQGFSACRRLSTFGEFDAVFKNNQAKVSTREFLLLAARNREDHSRLGMVISKKNTSHAVDRNRLKRLVREVFRKAKLPSVDVVVLTKAGANQQSKQILTNILEKSFQKISSRFNTEVT